MTEFRLQDVEKRAISLNANPAPIGPLVTAEQLWANVERFLQELLPVAEAAGVTLAMHPDDPPLPMFLGRGAKS